MEEEPIIDGEVIRTLPSKDQLSKCWWRMKDGTQILLKDMEDRHIRNTALFLMGMGYQKCVMDEGRRIMYLNLLRMEWERRMLNRPAITIYHAGKPINANS